MVGEAPSREAILALAAASRTGGNGSVLRWGVVDLFSGHDADVALATVPAVSPRHLA